MLVLILVTLVAVLAAGLYLFLDRRYSTWRRKGVPGPPASAFNLSPPKVLLGLESMGDIADRLYKEYRDCPVVGSYIFANPVLHLNDTEVIKQVLIKEFHDFSGRGDAYDYDPLSNNLFLLSGQRWRNLRVKLAPTFTSGKIKHMFRTIAKCSEQMADYIQDRVVASGGEHCEDARPIMVRLFVDTVSSVAFGIESNVFQNEASEFFVAAEKAAEPTLMNALRALLFLFGSRLRAALRVRAASADIVRFFTGIVHETVKYREENGVERADILDMLIQLKNRGFVAPDKEKDKEDAELAPGGESAIQKLTMRDISANVFIFFIAGFESSSATTSFTLYEMARQPHILAKAQQEVDQALADHDGQLTYDAIMNMPYLHKCVSETLRKYPPLAFVSRKAAVTRKVPTTEVVVEAGTTLVIPIRALHYDPVFWPDPERYDPERFSEEQKATRPSTAYLPFGDGPRICIAARLGLTQIKTALVTLLSKYDLAVAAAEPSKVAINAKAFATTPSGALNITFRPRQPSAGVANRKTSAA